MNEADLDLFEVTPWLWVTSNDFYKHLSSNAITKGSRKITPGKIPTHQNPPWKIYSLSSPENSHPENSHLEYSHPFH